MNAMTKLAVLLAVSACAQWYGPVVHAATIGYMAVDSGKGMLKGDSLRKGFEDKMEVQSYAYKVDTASGARQHGAVRITKRVGPASPQLFQALVGNEELRAVTIDFVQTNTTTGQQYVANTIRLSNARVSTIEQSGGVEPDEIVGGAKHGASHDVPIYETISFTFGTIEITNHDAKITAMDSQTGRP